MHQSVHTISTTIDDTVRRLRDYLTLSTTKVHRFDEVQAALKTSTLEARHALNLLEREGGIRFTARGFFQIVGDLKATPEPARPAATFVDACGDRYLASLARRLRRGEQLDDEDLNYLDDATTEDRYAQSLVRRLRRAETLDPEDLTYLDEVAQRPV